MAEELKPERIYNLTKKTTFATNDSILLDNEEVSSRIEASDFLKQIETELTPSISQTVEDNIKDTVANLVYENIYSAIDSSIGTYTGSQTSNSQAIYLTTNELFTKKLKDNLEDCMKITFKAKYDSANNMTVYLNYGSNSEYRKSAPIQHAGIGSFYTNDYVTLIYDYDNKVFLIYNVVNLNDGAYQTLSTDLDNYVYPCKIRAYIPKNTTNSPEPNSNLYGLFVVESDNSNFLSHQWFYGSSGRVYYRLTRNDGGEVDKTWYKVTTTKNSTFSITNKQKIK